MEHTPTPWKYEPSTKTLRALPSNYWLATIDSWDGAVDNTANAAFIVKAVNAHDKLVKALRDMLAMVERHGVWGNGPNGQPIASGGGPKETTIGNIICDAARAALADLEGE